MYRSYGKRAFDIVIACLALVVLLPIMLIIAIMIVMFDRGPIIFKQNRVGQNGSEFLFYKFRSMPVNTGDIPSDKIGSVNISWIGRLIRRTNLDELPQLINILKGDMSIVGPRPSISTQKELIELRKSNGSLALKPGLTGLAQIKSYDGMSVEKKAAYDGDYFIKLSFYTDIKIILSTFIYLIKPPPVY